MSGPAAPLTPTMKTSRPAARAASATARGSGPPPAAMPSLRGLEAGELMRRASACPWLARQAKRPVGPGLDEVHDLHHLGIALEALLDGRDTIAKRALGRKDLAIGIAQRVDLLAREATPLQADEVEPH